ncbi:MAG TPA: hypothetical protein VG709_01130, partial [Actinomycetota bacterium]|nr:hypothetical protein [Actinomycetota bacterium]
VEAVRAEMSSSVAERLAEMEREISAAVTSAGDDQRDAAASVVRIGEELRTEVERAVSSVRENVASLRSELERQAAALGEGMARVDRLGDAVETIGRRRAFRKLVDAERDLHREQVALVEELTSAGETVTGAVRDIEARIADAAESVAAAAERNADEVGAIREVRQVLESFPALLESRLTEAVDAVHADIVATGSRSEGSGDEIVSLREEIEALRSAVEGSAKRAPATKLARDVKALQGRIDDLEASMRDTLAKEVAQRVRASIDRRVKSFLDEIRGEVGKEGS